MTQKEALTYIYSKKQGLMSELRNHVDHEIILGFELTGLIQKGQESSRENSWKLTSEGEKIYRFANIETECELSWLDKLQGLVNSFFMNKKLFAAH